MNIHPAFHLLFHFNFVLILHLIFFQMCSLVVGLQTCHDEPSAQPGEPGYHEFIGRLALHMFHRREGAAAETPMIRGQEIAMLLEHRGEISITLDRQLFGIVRVETNGTVDEGHPFCGGQAWADSVTFMMRPFTVSDPRDAILALSLETRATEDALVAKGSVARGRRFCYATLLYSDSYVPGVVVLAASLRKVKSAYPLLVLVTNEGVGIAALGTLREAGCLIEMAQPLSTGTALESGERNGLGLGADIWLKLHLWRLVRYDRIVYLDADSFVLENIDALFALRPGSRPGPSGSMVSERFASTGDYFPGAFFVLTPSHDDLAAMTQSLLDREKIMGTAAFMWGEQDFLNDFWRGSELRANLEWPYYCIAEDIGTPGRDPVLNGDNGCPLCRSMEDRCKVVEYSSCDRYQITGVRWKPWMDPSFIAGGEPVCQYPASEAFWRVHERWLELYEAAGGPAGMPKPRPLPGDISARVT